MPSTSAVYLGGHAHMVRTGHDTTKVSVHVSGLVATRTYAVHVHNAACSIGGGTHYQFATAVPGGSRVGQNEIWPGR